jgi:hypothetical protein
VDANPVARPGNDERVPPSSAKPHATPGIVPEDAAGARRHHEAEILDGLAATIESVLATKWYGASPDRMQVPQVPRPFSTERTVAPVTQESLFSELSVVKEPDAPLPARGRGAKRIVLAICILLIALAGVVALSSQGGRIRFPWSALSDIRILPAARADSGEGRVAPCLATPAASPGALA